ncbi:MAG: hypothetical protein PQJ59_16945 [Spirochaetales bacterium]|nr:hypothetical protein [Spirochaetales bacterium]
MKGIQEVVSYHEHYTLKRDLFCGKCFDLVKMNVFVKKDVTYKCPHCGEVNEYGKDDPLRHLKRTYNKKFPIVYWARKYGIPENSCYMAFRRRGLYQKNHISGNPIKITKREFLAGVLYTTKGRDVVSRLIVHEKLLTEETLES